MNESVYTEELADKICEQLAQGKSMVKAAEELGVSRRTVYLWLKNKPDFANKTVDARDQWSDEMFDQLIAISRDETIDVKRARLITDSMKWYMGKQRPKKYSEKFLVEHGGEVEHKHTIAEMTDAELERIARTSSSRTSEEEEG